MRTYNLSDRKLTVRSITTTSVIYDVDFKPGVESEFDRKEREILGVPLDVVRNPRRNQILNTAKFATMIGRQGHYLKHHNPAVQKIVQAAVADMSL